MTLQETIKKATEGGYGKVHWNPLENRLVLGEIDGFQDNIYKFFLDPLFWQALGKAMGDDDFRSQPDIWKNRWHRFIDHLAGGKTTEEFFNNLIPPHQVGS